MFSRILAGTHGSTAAAHRLVSGFLGGATKSVLKLLQKDTLMWRDKDKQG